MSGLLRALSGVAALLVILSVWAGWWHVCLAAAVVAFMGASLARAIDYFHRPRRSVFGPVNKFGISEDAVHEGYRNQIARTLRGQQ